MTWITFVLWRSGPSALCDIVHLTGGHVAGSLAVLTDAAHLLIDLASFLLSLFSLWLSSQPPSKRLTFGWYRAGNGLRLPNNECILTHTQAEGSKQGKVKSKALFKNSLWATGLVLRIK